MAGYARGIPIPRRAGGRDPQLSRVRTRLLLMNRYEPGSRLSLHQDRNQRDFDAPIVSVSLGLPATFLWGGAVRGDKPMRVRLFHGDVVVWGGLARLTLVPVNRASRSTRGPAVATPGLARIKGTSGICLVMIRTGSALADIVSSWPGDFYINGSAPETAS